MSVQSMLDQCRKTLGLGEPNWVQRYYEKKAGVGYNGNWAWCDGWIHVMAYLAGEFEGVCNGRWEWNTVRSSGFFPQSQRFEGTVENVKNAKPGDLVYFDWSGTNNRANIDHVGIVEKNLGGGRLQTLEGNISDKVVRKVREASTIAVICRPKYKGASKPTTPPAKPAPRPVVPGRPTVSLPDGSPVLEFGDGGEEVKALQKYMNYALNFRVKLDEDGVFGGLTKSGVKRLQTYSNVVRSKTGAEKLSVDGVYGPKTAGAFKKVLAYLKK